jgi:glycosyltransferase involved in cell wall biosynthesis
VNILFLSELFYPHGGGAELATYTYANLLGTQKHNVIVITNRFVGEADSVKNENFVVYRIPLLQRNSAKFSIMLRFDVLFSSLMRKWLKWADVVYIPRFWYSAVPLAKAYGKPVITHLHDYIPICPLVTKYDSEHSCECNRPGACSPRCIYLSERRNLNVLSSVESTFLNWSLRPLWKSFLEYSDAVICVSGAQKDTLVEHLSFLKNKVNVIYNPLPEIEQLKICGDNMGYFGGLSSVKGFYVLLKALKTRREKGFEPISIHCAKLFSPNDSFVSTLKNLGFIAHGKLVGEEYERVYRDIKAVVVPSICPEPLPYVVPEGILRGRIVVASSIGGIPEQTKGCKGVLLHEPGNFEQLAELLGYARGLSKATIEDYSAYDRGVIAKRFQKEDSIRKFESILNKVLDDRDSHNLV